MFTIVSRQFKLVRNFKSSQVLTTRNRITINYRKEHRKEPSRARSQMKIWKSKKGSQAWLRNRITFFGFIGFTIFAASPSICWDLLICMQALVFLYHRLQSYCEANKKSSTITIWKQTVGRFHYRPTGFFICFFFFLFLSGTHFCPSLAGLLSQWELTHGCWSSYLSWEAT